MKLMFRRETVTLWFGRLSIDRELIVLLTIPFILLLANTQWLFPAGNPTDAWQSKAFFLQGPRDWPELYDSYKAARISWNIKGYVVHHLFSAHVAHYVLHIGMFCGLIAAFYLVVRDLLGRNVAFLAAAAFATYSQFQTVTSFEWDYQVHDGALNVLIAMFCLARAAKPEAPGWRKWLVGAGVFWAQGLQTVYMAAFVPAMAVWYLALNHRGGRRPVAASVLWVLAGGFAATLGFCLLSFSMGGPFLFFSGIILPFKIIALDQTTGSYRFHPGYWAPLSEILKRGRGLAVPAASSVACAFLLVRVLVSRWHGSYIASVVLCLTVFVGGRWGGLVHAPDRPRPAGARQHHRLPGAFRLPRRCRGVRLPAPGRRAHGSRQRQARLGDQVDLAGPAAGRVDLRSRCFRMGSPSPRCRREGLGSGGARASNIAKCIDHRCGLPWLVFLFSSRLISRKQASSLSGSAKALSLSAWLALMNNQTTSIPISSYDAFNKYGYHEAQYQAVIDIFSHFLKYKFSTLWYKYNEKEYFVDYKGKSEIKYGPLYGAALGLMGYSLIAGKEQVFYLMEPYLSTESFDLLAIERAYMLPRRFDSLFFRTIRKIRRRLWRRFEETGSASPFWIGEKLTTRRFPLVFPSWKLPRTTASGRRSGSTFDHDVPAGRPRHATGAPSPSAPTMPGPTTTSATP